MDYEGKEFNDPVLRCDQCSKLSHRDFIAKNAGCCHCGNKRFKNVRGMSPEEHAQLETGALVIGKKDYKIDPDFLALFKEVGDE